VARFSAASTFDCVFRVSRLPLQARATILCVIVNSASFGSRAGKPSSGVMRRRAQAVRSVAQRLLNLAWGGEPFPAELV
jgi:hypothetical protein